MQNLALMRRDNLEERFLEYLDKNIDSLIWPEQQIVNIVCFPHIHIFHPKGMVLAWDYDNFKTESDFERDVRYSSQEVKEALAHPVQLHYAGGFKPWNVCLSTKSYLWWLELLCLCKVAVTIEALYRLIVYGRHIAWLKSQYHNRISIKLRFFR